jgi:hypothetical protein
MECTQILNGGSTRIIKYPIAATTIANIMLLKPAAGGNGLAQSTATSCADAVGLSLDSGTYGTAQNADGSNPESQVSVIVNPDAVYRIKLSGGSSNGTALSKQTVTTASTTGLAVTTAAAWSSPTFDEGTVWGYSGANVGPEAIRKITSVSSTAGTVSVAFANDIAVGDEFLRAPFALFTVSLTLTSTLDQVDCSVALSASAAELIPINNLGLLRDVGSDGTTNSFIDCIAGDHMFSGRP